MTDKLQKYLLRALVLAGLFAQGAWVGMLLRSDSSETSAATDSSELEATSNLLPISSQSGGTASVDNQLGLAIHTPLQHRQLAEQLLLKDDFAGAIAHLLNAAPAKLNQADDDLKFRISLCLEASRDFKRALTLYDGVFRSATNKHLANLARYGVARCRLGLGDTAGCRQLLWQNSLQNNTLQRSEADTDSVYWLALSYGVEKAGVKQDLSSSELLRSDLVIPALRPALSVSRQVRSLTNGSGIPPNSKPANSEQSAAPVRTSESDDSLITIDNIMRAGDELEDIVASFSAEQANLFQLFQWTSARLSVPFEITEIARQVAQQQSVTLALRHVGLAAALDAQTLPFDLAWVLKDGKVSIYAQHEVPSAESGRFVMDASLRLLQQIDVVSADYHHFGHARFLAAGFLNEIQQPERASAIYSDLLGRSIDPQLRQACNYNLAQIQTELADLPQALESYGRVVDSNEGSLLQAVASIKIGQSNLRIDKPDQAITHFLRAYRMTDDRFLRQVAQLDIASAYLMNEQSSLAKDTLQRARELFSNSELNDVAEFLKALAQYDESNKKLTQDERTQLLAILSYLDWPEYLGPHGHLLMATAYRILGFNDEAIGLLQYSVATLVKCALRKDCFKQLVLLLEQEKRSEELREVLVNALYNSEADTDGFVTYMLASLEFQTENHESCLEYCRALLARPATSPYQAQALSLMGEILHKRGEYSHAALCFAGLFPQDTTSPDSNPIVDPGGN